MKRPKPKLNITSDGVPDFLGELPEAVRNTPVTKDRVLAVLQRMTPQKANQPIAEFTRMANGILSEVKYVVRTGIRVFDIITGCFPMGRVVEVYGVDACGKTAMAKRGAISAQIGKICKRITTLGPDNVKRVTYEPISPDSTEVHVVYFDLEQSIDDDNSLIIDGVKANFILARCDTIGQIFDAMQRVIQAVEVTKKEALKALEAHKEKDGPKPIIKEQFIFVVVDTLAAASTDGELEGDWGQQDYSRHAKEIRQAFRKITREINKYNLCLMCINQVSDSFAPKKKFNAPGAMPDETEYSTFGGRAMKFYATWRVLFQRVPLKYKLHPDNVQEDGLLIEIKTVKNRLKKPLRKGRLVLLFGDENSAGGGYSDLYSLLETFIMLGLAETDSSGEVTFRLKANGVSMSTFDKKNNPSIANRLEWPAFYTAHQSDFDELWTKAQHLIFSVEQESDPLALDDDGESVELFGTAKEIGPIIDLQ
jgi:RecA/RadA recombinase